jgi:hypothetical protein
MEKIKIDLTLLKRAFNSTTDEELHKELKSRIDPLTLTTTTEDIKFFMQHPAVCQTWRTIAYKLLPIEPIQSLRNTTRANEVLEQVSNIFGFHPDAMAIAIDSAPDQLKRRSIVINSELIGGIPTIIQSETNPANYILSFRGDKT